MPITQQDIANELGVSRRLVSYAINGENGVGTEMRARILKMADELGYQTNRAAKTLVTGRTHQIALSMESLADPFHVQYVHQFESLARQSPYDLVVTTQLKPSIAVDGVLYYDAHPPAMEMNCPVVALLSPPYWQEDSPRYISDEVRLDLQDAARAIMRHLLDQGARHIAFVSYESMLRLRKDEIRYVIYCEEMRRAGLATDVISIPWGGNIGARDTAHLVLQKHFSTHPTPHALVCLNDEIAIGAYRVLRELGKQIPEDVMVTGCDDILGTEDMFPPLTTVKMPWKEMCRRAWEILLARIENPRLAMQKSTFYGEAVIRESVRIN